MKKRDSIKNNYKINIRDSLIKRFIFLIIISLLIYLSIFIFNQNYSIMAVLFILTIFAMIYLFVQAMILIRQNLESGRLLLSILCYVIVFLWITFLISNLFNISQLNNWGSISYNCPKNSDSLLNKTDLASGEFFYFTATTILTIGYGDICPFGFSRVLAGLTGFIGMFMYIGFIFLLAKYYILNKNNKR
ncbi:MAG: potassium channel family protein [Candidatus Nanoarchaeia archaeon]|nr:potassium channel family protein [Candidatus Nanoarchaeia archaeon]